MNNERSQRRGLASPNLKNQRMISSKNKVNQLQTSQHFNNFKRSISNNQVNSFKSSVFGWDRHCQYSYFSLGLFWGIVTSLIAIFSGGLGVTATKIDAVEKAIAQKIRENSPQEQLDVELGLSSAVNVLLIEVEPEVDELLKFSDDFVGKSKTILLLKFDPQQGLARVINIPPDTRVQIPGLGWGTMADAHKYGGVALVSRMVNRLMDNITIDHYLRATPETFKQLIATGKLNFPDCDSRVKDCSNKLKQVTRQQHAFEDIRQRLNIFTYRTSFKTTVSQVKPNLDTNMSVPKVISLANFVKELEPDNITVDLLPGYIPGQSIAINNQGNLEPSDLDQLGQDGITLTTPVNKTLNQHNPWQNNPIAVQNTTESPELGRQVVAYLRRQNFLNVYLVEPIPLKLEQTKILIDQSQLKTANELRGILGFGSLESQSSPRQKELTIQIGEDAHYLYRGYRFYN